ncbi:LysR family transcriptional regulator [Shewanella waksmanii]|uniref:LysR family transcriptional regulator n=1 Tax=Shewanella waksmanii TaxID=213783 RepID=UPI0037361AED
MQKLAAIEDFIRVVKLGSFSAVAAEKQVSQSSISKRVAALEQSLGLQLLHRSSRKLSLTNAGEHYFNQCQQILTELRDVEAQLQHGNVIAKGQLKVSIPVSLAETLLVDMLAAFADDYPHIELSISLNDQYVDLIAEDYDVVIRAGELTDSNLKARHLFNTQAIYVCSPSYLNHSPELSSPDDLYTHRSIGYSLSKRLTRWPFIDGQRRHHITIDPSIRCNNANLIMQLAIKHQGIALLPSWMVMQAIESKKLTRVFADFGAVEMPVQALYLPSAHTPLKIRCFIDSLVAHFNHNKPKRC